MGKTKRTPESFREEVAQINPNIEVIGDYIKVHTKITFKCKICGNEWDAEPNSILHGSGCPECGKIKCKQNRTKTLEQFLAELKEIHPSIKCLSKKYINTDTRLQFRCLDCGYIWETSPQSILKRKGCPKCSRQNGTKLRTKTNQQFLEELSKINPNLIILDEYKNIRSAVRYKCNICGFEHQASPQHLLEGHGCPNCYKIKQHYTLEQFIEKARKIHGDKYNYSGSEYVNSKTKIKIICPEHGEFWQEPSQHLLGSGCPMCQRTYGEQLIATWLESNNIKFLEQTKIFTSNIARNANYVIVDFIVNYNDKVYYIEFNGKQHYMYIPYFHKGGEIDFKKQQQRDLILKNHCIDNSIILIEIPYYENTYDRVSHILNNYFK